MLNPSKCFLLQSIFKVIIMGTSDFTALDVASFKEAMSRGALALDNRSAVVTIDGFIPGTITIGKETSVMAILKELFPNNQEIILIAAPGNEIDFQTRLLKAGFKNVTGYLSGGYTSWLDAGLSTDMLISVDPDELMMDLPFDPKLTMVDLRSEFEFGQGHLKAAINLPIVDLADIAEIANYDDDQNIYLISSEISDCIIAATMFKKFGLHNIRFVNGGWQAIEKTPAVKIIRDTPTLN